MRKLSKGLILSMVLGVVVLGGFNPKVALAVKSTFSDMVQLFDDIKLGFGGADRDATPDVSLVWDSAAGVLELRDSADVVLINHQEIVDTRNIAFGQNAIISGGVAVWSGSGLVFNVSAAEYYIQGTRYTFAGDNVTLATADGSNPRIDAIVLTTAGAVDKVTGTPGADPAQPDIDPELYVQVTFVLVATGATTPTVTETDVYQEGSEWTDTQSGGTITLESTNDPHSGTNSIEATASDTNHYVDFASADFDISTYDILQFRIKIKSAWASTRRLRIAWFESGSVQGVTLNLEDGDFGLDFSDTADYQQITIPMTAFGLPGSTVDSLRMVVRGTGATVGFFLDDIIIQTGLEVGAVQPAIITVNGDTGTWTSPSAAGAITLTGGANVTTSVNSVTGEVTIETTAAADDTPFAIGDNEFTSTSATADSLYLRRTDTNSGTRFYMMPNGSGPGAGLQSGWKVFFTDFSADQTNYADTGFWADTNLSSSASGGVAVWNSKYAGSYAGAPDMAFVFQDTVVGGRWIYGGGTPKLIIGSGTTVTNSKARLSINGGMELAGASFASAPTELTISSGAVALPASPTTNFFQIDTEGDASTDNLDNITGGGAYEFIILQTANSARDVTIQYNQGTNGKVLLNGGASFVMDTVRDRVLLMRAVDDAWVSIGLLDND